MTRHGPRSQALDLAAEFLERRRDEAAAASTRAQARMHDARTTLRTLEDYREELSRRRREHGSLLALGAAGLANASAFALRLGEAVDAQLLRVDEQEQLAQHSRAALVADQRRLKAIEWLIERRTRAAAALNAKRERIENEEWTNARHALQLARGTPSKSSPHDPPRIKDRSS